MRGIKLGACKGNPVVLKQSLSLAGGNQKIVLGNGTSKPTGIQCSTHTHTCARFYPWPHRYSFQNKPLFIQNDQELNELWAKQLSFFVLLITLVTSHLDWRKVKESPSTLPEYPIIIWTHSWTPSTPGSVLLQFYTLFFVIQYSNRFAVSCVISVGLIKCTMESPWSALSRAPTWRPACLAR